MKWILFSLLLSMGSQSFAETLPTHYNDDWTAHSVCQKDSRYKQTYCLEVLEFNKFTGVQQHVALLIPGIFENGRLFDVLPNEGISVARYLARNYGIKSYILNIRGIGKSDYPSHSNLDSVAMDDVPYALDYIYQKEKQKVILIGHSQGAIVAQAALAGLKHAHHGNHFFDENLAIARQQKTKGLIMLAGNSAMTMDSKTNPFLHLAKLSRSENIEKLFLHTDLITVQKISQLKGGAYFLHYINEIIPKRNIAKHVRYALLHSVFEAASGRMLLQYAKAIENRDMQTTGGHSYTNAGKNIKLIPVAQQTYEIDNLAEAEATYRDSFLKIGTRKKYFEILDGHTHSDVLLNANMHTDLNNVINFILN